MKKSILAALVVLSWAVSAQDSLNINKIGRYDYGNIVGSDIWGYTAPDGSEYALMGLRNGLSIVNITQTPALNEVLRISGVPSVWRDIKTWGHHAYITHDQTLIPSIMPAQGVLIVNMDSIELGRTPTYHNLFLPFIEPNTNTADSIRTCHNLYIDENGIMYLFGCNFPQSGVAVLYDVASNPDTPVSLGTWGEHYLHDGIARGDTLWGSAVYAGEFDAIDVSNKAKPQTMASFPTSSAFTHNCWISDDNKTLFTTDEVPEAYIGAYDVADFNNITEIDLIQSSLDSLAIPHNTHVYNNFLVTSYYTSGLQIVDANVPDILVEVGYYDTSPFGFSSSFQGAWGAYPYFPSGKIAVSDMEEGLFVLSSDYPRASYWRGVVVNGLTNAPIIGASLQEQNGLFRGNSNINGRFKWGGLADSILVEVQANGFNTAIQNIDLISGVVKRDTIYMFPLGFGLTENHPNQFRIFPNPSADGQITIDGLRGNTEWLKILDLQGRVLIERNVLGIAGSLSLQPQLPAGTYLIQLSDTQGRKYSYRQVLF